jgi:hypothetical protein
MASPLPLPLARTQDVVVKAVRDELLVYDLARHHAHSLNAVAAAVWQRCDGTRDPATLAAELGAEGRTVTVEVVRYALVELRRARLLTDADAEPAVTRRELMRRLGTAAAVALPVVTSIVAPTPAQAQSPGVCHPLCETGPALNVECDPCVAQICAADSFCCSTGWDSICVGEVTSICGQSCGPQTLSAPTPRP